MPNGILVREIVVVNQTAGQDALLLPAREAAEHFLAHELAIQHFLVAGAVSQTRGERRREHIALDGLGGV